MGGSWQLPFIILLSVLLKYAILKQFRFTSKGLRYQCILFSSSPIYTPLGIICPSSQAKKHAQHALEFRSSPRLTLLQPCWQVRAAWISSYFLLVFSHLNKFQFIRGRSFFLFFPAYIYSEILSFVDSVKHDLFKF